MRACSQNTIIRIYTIHARAPIQSINGEFHFSFLFELILYSMSFRICVTRSYAHKKTLVKMLKQLYDNTHTSYKHTRSHLTISGTLTLPHTHKYIDDYCSVYHYMEHSSDRSAHFNINLHLCFVSLRPHWTNT